MTYELVGNPLETPLDYSIYRDPAHDPGEYIGMAYYGNAVWSSYTGSFANEFPENDPPANPVHESVIYSSKVSLPP